MTTTVRLQRETFDAAAEAAKLTRGRSDIGAVVSFTGICRGDEAGEPIAALTLEHYPGMAEDEIARHVAEAYARWPLMGVTVIHRYGRIEPGEDIVLVVTASSHRQAAFAAAEFLMDYLKTRRRSGSRSKRPAPRTGWRRKTATTRRPSAGAARRRNERAPSHDRGAGRAGGVRSCAAQARAAQIKYYAVPRGAHPHDVAPAPDGMVWYTAQAQGAIGILDPKTGKTVQLPLGRSSAPHGVIVGPDRAAWITDGGQNAIARVDSLTHAVKLFPLPKDFPDANLNTATFDRKGILWFTGQNGVYGRVDPATGKVEAWKAPKGVGPYGITTTPKGEVWYASLAGDHIAKIDTVSGDVRRWCRRPSAASARAASGRTPRACCG